MSKITLTKNNKPIKVFKCKVDMFKWMENNIKDRQELLMYDYRNSTRAERLIHRILTIKYK